MLIAVVLVTALVAGLDYVFARFKPRLERELGRDLAETIFVANPARAFAFDPR